MKSDLKINIISLLNNYETVLENELKIDNGGMFEDVYKERLKRIEETRKEIAEYV